jgi:hypothetical protein
MTELLGIGVIQPQPPGKLLRDGYCGDRHHFKEPVFNGEWISKGTHINAVGSSFISKQELDVATAGRACGSWIPRETESSDLYMRRTDTFY